MKRGSRYRPFSEALESATSPADFRAAASRILEPLREYDRLHAGDLLHTMEVYFACRQNASKAADALFLHRNGLLYRLARVEELIGAPLSNREVALALELALRAAGDDAGAAQPESSES